MTVTRRKFSKYSAGLIAALATGFSGVSLAGNPTGKRLHGLSTFGDLKYGPDYPHFDYVNPAHWS